MLVPWLLPVVHTHNTADGRLSHMELLGKLLLSDAACGVTGSNRIYLTLCQYRAAVLLSALSVASFGDHIVRVVLGRSDKQVIRADAILYVTLVEKVKAIWNWSIDALPCPSMRFDGSSSVVSVELPVAFDFGSRPQPTGICFPNFRPKALRCWYSWVSHRCSPLSRMMFGQDGCAITLAFPSVYSTSVLS